MGIFSKIKDAIFGHKAAAQTPDQAQTPAAAPQATPGAPPSPTTAPAAPVNVEDVLASIAVSKGNPGLNYKSSIVDLMKLLDLDSSLENRKVLATELGYTGAKDGSADMNIWLHKEVMRLLATHGGKVPESIKD